MVHFREVDLNLEFIRSDQIITYWPCQELKSFSTEGEYKVITC